MLCDTVWPCTPVAVRLFFWCMSIVLVVLGYDLTGFSTAFFKYSALHCAFSAFSVGKSESKVPILVESGIWSGAPNNRRVVTKLHLKGTHMII